MNNLALRQSRGIRCNQSWAASALAADFRRRAKAMPAMARPDHKAKVAGSGAGTVINWLWNALLSALPVGLFQRFSTMTLAYG